MKIAIKILKKLIQINKDDLLMYKRMARDKTNSIEMNDYFKDKMNENIKIIESLENAIVYLKYFPE